MRSPDALRQHASRRRDSEVSQMNAQRLEEFRKKLREGRPVDVTGGVVRVEGRPADPATPNGSPPNPAANHGVQVKPHEWGVS